MDLNHLTSVVSNQAMAVYLKLFTLSHLPFASIGSNLARDFAFFMRVWKYFRSVEEKYYYINTVPKVIKSICQISVFWLNCYEYVHYTCEFLLD